MEPAATQPGHLRASETSLGNLWEFVLSLLEVVAAGSVAEIGAFRGELTRDLLTWAERADAEVIAIDPKPPAELLRLQESNQRLRLINRTSLEALRHIAMPDVVIIDGDHNYYTVSEELRAIEDRAVGDIPLLLFHDVAWPLARRDTYHSPERIPAEHRQPLLPDVGLSSEPDFAADRPFAHVAAREGGPRNGVLTAIEDFLAERSGIRLAVIPAFFGFGVLWRNDAPWGAAVANIVAPFDRHPVLERLERDRVVRLLTQLGTARQLAALEQQNDELREQLVSKDTALQATLTSRTYALSKLLSSLATRARFATSRLRAANLSKRLVSRHLNETEGAHVDETVTPLHPT